METFDFPYFKYRTTYPQSAGSVQFGRGWVFTSKPDAPDQRTFTLQFAGLGYFFNSSGNVSPTVISDRNLRRFEEFYQRHNTHTAFLWTHPVWGELRVKFKKPLDIPYGLEDGGGHVEAFEIELIEVPT